jgi:fatty acid desaturase
VLWVREPDAGRRLTTRLDSLLVLGFVGAQLVLVLLFSPTPLLAIATLVLWPFVVMNWFVSAITLMHHRHPQVRWFDSEAQWTVFAGQVAGTVHVVWPRWLGATLLNIFEHGAHHIDLRRPFCALPAAQQALERAFAGEVQVVIERQPWRLQHLRRVMRECQLYDYQSHQWLRWQQFNNVAAAATRPANPTTTAPQTQRTAAP